MCIRDSAIVGNESVEIIGIEDLKIKSMTARPEPKKFEDEEFLPNGANAKAGLNKAILAVYKRQLPEYSSLTFLILRFLSKNTSIFYINFSYFG